VLATSIKQDIFISIIHFRCVRNIAKSDSFVMSVHPHGTAQLPLDGFSLDLILEDFSKICQE